MYELKPGYLEITRIRKIPVFLHWSFPLGAILPATFVGFHFAQSVYLCIGYVLLIGTHELGHAVAARLCKLEVLALEISGFGGMCWTERPESPKAALLLFSGGLLAQLALLLFTAGSLAVFGRPPTLFLNCLVLMFTVVNSIIFLVNIVPTRGGNQPTDGYVIWKVIEHLRKGHA